MLLTTATATQSIWQIRRTTLLVKVSISGGIWITWLTAKLFDGSCWVTATTAKEVLQAVSRELNSIPQLGIRSNIFDMLMDRGLSMIAIAQNDVSIVISSSICITAAFLDIHQSLLPRLLLISLFKTCTPTFLNNFDHLRFLTAIMLKFWRFLLDIMILLSLNSFITPVTHIRWKTARIEIDAARIARPFARVGDFLDYIVRDFDTFAGAVEIVGNFLVVHHWSEISLGSVGHDLPTFSELFVFLQIDHGHLV